MRNPPRSSVTARKLLPVAVWTAVTVTPGSTPPVLSVTVPESTASWASAICGSAIAAQTARQTASIRLMKHQRLVMDSPLVQGSATPETFR